MTRKLNRIKALFNALPQGICLSVLDVHRIVGGFWLPWGEVQVLANQGFLKREKLGSTSTYVYYRSRGGARGEA